MLRYHGLTENELKVIEQKGTEAPFTGQYDKFHDPGIYTCKKCDFPLFISDQKFNSGCGWPSFDAAIENHVLSEQDSDGKRCEILCNRCKAHLGHVFKGEHLTPKNTRHCVNSISLRFIPAFTNDALERAVFAGGCFWGVEYFLKKEKGVKQIFSGYIGGHVTNPTYDEVSSGLTGHVEAIEILFDPETTSYENLLKAFFSIHDFTQKTGQGPDMGAQYLSKIFIFSTKQKIAAAKIINELKKMHFDVASTIEYGSVFYKAEDYHQSYYDKTGKVPYCHIKKKIFANSD